jgi:hypothetical protein
MCLIFSGEIADTHFLVRRVYAWTLCRMAVPVCSAVLWWRKEGNQMQYSEMWNVYQYYYAILEDSMIGDRFY